MLAHQEASYALRIMPAEPGPFALDRVLPMVARAWRLLAALSHRAGSRPLALDRASPWLHPTEGACVARGQASCISLVYGNDFVDERSVPDETDLSFGRMVRGNPTGIDT